MLSPSSEDGEGMPPAKESLLQKLNWRAILLGIVTDIAATEVFGFVIAVAAGANFAANGAKPEEFDSLLMHSTNILITYEVGGLFFTAMGGFVAGCLAPQARYWNALAVGLVDVLYGLTSVDGNLPAWFNVTGFAATLPCALLGAFVAGLVARREEVPPSAPED
jgi:hypothetical protein